jgi:hypothetical protein
VNHYGLMILIAPGAMDLDRIERSQMAISMLRPVAILNADAEHPSRDNTLIKVMLGLSAALLIFAPPPARAGDATAGHDYRPCKGYYALCSASICKPTGKHIRVNVTGDGTAIFPEVERKCPIFSGVARADVTGGNMQGSCEPPGPGQIWSLYFPKENIPQEINNWAVNGRGAKAPLQVCPKGLNLGSQTSNCFSFSCDSETFINGVPVASCHCPEGESFAGTQLPSQTVFATQAGQGIHSIVPRAPCPYPSRCSNHGSGG